MAKKVLVVEESLAVRGIAESLLRQNGYEVFSAAGADEARTILQGSRIEILLVSSTAADAGGRRLIDTLTADPATASLPFLVLHDPTSGEPGFPPEMMIHKPFTPREFLDAVGAIGTFRPAAPAAPASPFDGATIEDDIIDAALGLDRLEVDDSKVIGDDTGAFRVLNAKPTKESMIGYEYGTNADDSGAMRKKIDQVSIRDSGATVVPPQPPAAGPAETHPPKESAQPPVKQAAPETLSGSSQIEIVSDQYGMVTPPEQMAPMFDEAVPRTHDYDWFINELKKEGPKLEDIKPPRTAADSGSRKVMGNADVIAPTEPLPAPQAPSHQDAIDKFISEFKREIESLPETAIPSVSITPPEASSRTSSDREAQPLGWQEAVERISASDIKAMSRELVDAVAAKIAERVVAQLDQETVYRILTDCFREVLDHKIPKPDRSR